MSKYDEAIAEETARQRERHQQAVASAILAARERVARERQEFETAWTFAPDPASLKPEAEQLAAFNAAREQARAAREESWRNELENAAFLVEQPEPEELIAARFAFLKDETASQPQTPRQAPDLAKAVYQIADGIIYSVEEKKFISGRDAPDSDKLIRLSDSGRPASVQYLRATLELYGLPIGDELYQPHELEQLRFSRLREKRASLLTEYDAAISQLNRQLREAGEESRREAINAKIRQWDAYASALCDLPAREGAPWDGADSTPWPEKPE